MATSRAKSSERVTCTVNYHVFQSAKNDGTALQYRKYTTLNELEEIDIFAGEVADINEIKMKHFCVGRGAAKAYTTQTGVGATMPYEFDPRFNNLYKLTPLIMRTLDNDLTSLEREGFALIKDRTINGKVYRCYYLAPIDKLDSKITISVYDRQGDKETTEEYVAKESDLNPVPINTLTPGDESSNTTNVEVSRDVWVEKLCTITFNEWLIEEYKNVIKILYGAAEPAIINEIGLVISGSRSRQLKDQTGATFNYTEALHAQLAVFVNASLNFTQDASYVKYKLNIAANEPLPAGSIITGADE